MSPARTTGTRLEDVLEDFAISAEPLEARISRFAAHYPQYESDLRALSADLGRLADSPPASSLSVEGERLVEHGLQLLENAVASPSSAARSESTRDVFEGRSAKELRLLAQRWALPLTFVVKLRDRLIQPTSIPSSFVAWLASTSGERASDFAHSFSLPPRLSPSLQFKADKKPSTQLQQTFEDAIESSSMAKEQKQRLRAFLD